MKPICVFTLALVAAASACSSMASEEANQRFFNEVLRIWRKEQYFANEKAKLEAIGRQGVDDEHLVQTRDKMARLCGLMMYLGGIEDKPQVTPNDMVRALLSDVSKLLRDRLDYAANYAEALSISTSINSDISAINRQYAKRAPVRQQSSPSDYDRKIAEILANMNAQFKAQSQVPPQTPPQTANDEPVRGTIIIPAAASSATKWFGVVAVKNSTAAQYTYEICSVDVNGVPSEWLTVNAQKGEQWVHSNPECVEFHVRLTLSDGSQVSYKLPASRVESKANATEEHAKKYRISGNLQHPFRVFPSDD